MYVCIKLYCCVCVCVCVCVCMRQCIQMCTLSHDCCAVILMNSASACTAKILRFHLYASERSQCHEWANRYLL